jgi:hypothetical protein
VTPYEKINLGLAAFQSIVLLAVLIVYARQLSTMRGQLDAAKQASSGQNLLSLANFLQAEDVREARRIVFEALKGRHFSNWTPDERRAAAKVCSSYGTAGIVLEMGVVPQTPIIDNWGPSIRNCYPILAEFIGDLQRPEVNGPGYWAVFDRLYALAAEGPKDVV